LFANAVRWVRPRLGATGERNEVGPSKQLQLAFRAVRCVATL
jgi:hypothetical protein